MTRSPGDSKESFPFCIVEVCFESFWNLDLSVCWLRRLAGADTKVPSLFLNLITPWRNPLPPGGGLSLSWETLLPSPSIKPGGAPGALGPRKELTNDPKLPLGVTAQAGSVPLWMLSWAHSTGLLSAINRTALGEGEWEAGQTRHKAC